MSRERLDYVTRALFSGVCAVFLAYVAWLIISRFSSIFILLAAAALLAFVITPLVDWLDRALWRPVAVLVTYLGIAGILLGGGYLLFGPVVAQLSEAVAHLPTNNRQIHLKLIDIDNTLHHYGLTSISLANSQDKVISTLQARGDDLVTRTLTLATSVASLLLNALVCLVMSIYLVLDGKGIHDRVLRLVPEKYRQRIFFVEAAVNTVVGGYVRGQLILELTVGFLAGVGCWWLGLPYPALLGITAAILELVPMLGPMLASVPPLLLALAGDDPGRMVIKVLLYFFVIQQFETNVLGPRITGHAVGLHPLGAIIALMVGAELGGPLGAIVAAPAAGLLYVLGAAVFWHLTGQKVPTRRRQFVLRAVSHSLRREPNLPSGVDVQAPEPQATAADLSVVPPAPPPQIRAVEEARDALIARFEESLAEQRRLPETEEPLSRDGTRGR